MSTHDDDVVQLPEGPVVMLTPFGAAVYAELERRGFTDADPPTPSDWQEVIAAVYHAARHALLN